MLKLISIFLIFVLNVYSLDFTVASYNIENLFDLKKDGTEYKEYKPNTKYWNKTILAKKLKNSSKIIKDLNADILALQEIESQKALDLLLAKLPMYKYSFFLKNPHSSVGVAIISKYKISKTKKIDINSYDKYTRPILMTEVIIDNKPLKIYINHWRSKRAKESTRTRYAVALKNDIINTPNDEYILLGDFNSNYNEYKTFKYDKKLNNTHGITGINHILNTIIDEKLVLKEYLFTYDSQIHYNLWLDLQKNNRFSSKFRGEYNTPDNILLPISLFDNKSISYVNNSYKVFKPSYLYKNKKINRWNKNKGYSDHLPIIATFTTDKIYNNKQFIIKKNSSINNKVKHLYNIEHINNPINLTNVVVIYKNKNSAILKQTNKNLNSNGRAIYAYNCAKELKLGSMYNLKVNEIDIYHGLLEIKDISNIKLIKNDIDVNSLFLNGKKINLFDLKYTNDIVTNLSGKYKNGYLYLENNQRIKLYFHKKLKKPRKNSMVKINQGHLGVYKNQIQILIHKKSDLDLIKF